MLVRSYLRWLYEFKDLMENPDDLIRTRDLPKMPSYLPRPLPPEIDREIQDRFAKSGNIYLQGFLLMRKTGIRIGELRNLSFDCIKSDFNSNFFLKVPLGKLNSERLIPLDHETLELTKKLQQWYLLYKNRQYLLVNNNGHRRSLTHMFSLFNEACHGIRSAEPITSHRMRHSFATQMLNSGVSLLSLKQLLGHRSIHMTLRYCSVTQETVRTEYFSALKRLGIKYELPPNLNKKGNLDLNQAFSDLLCLLRKWTEIRPETDARKIALIIRRIRRIENDLQQMG
jgi:site-specific recombinase XerD